MLCSNLLVSLRNALSQVARAGVVLGAMGAGIAATTCASLDRPTPPWLLVSVFALVLPSYGIDRLRDASADAVAHPERAALYEGRREALTALYLACFGVALLAASTAGAWAVAAVMAFPFSVVLYVVPMLPARFTMRRLKDIPYGKGVYTALCWGALAPLAARWSGAQVDGRVAALALLAAGSIWITTVVCDLKDLLADRAAGVRTLPVRLGRARTLAVLRAVNLATTALGVGLPALQLTTSAAASAALVTGLAAHLYLHRLALPGADDRFYGEVVSDGAVALWLPVALLAAR
jgi:4-hydroxybenzoate polyprenyltransferase